MEKNGNKIISFSHDVNSRNDIKIIYLINEMGYEGYGIFWSILELIFQNNGSMPYDITLISKALNINDNEKIITILTKYNLFTIENNSITSNSIKRRINKIKEKELVNTENLFPIKENIKIDKNRYLGQDINNVVYDLDMLNGKIYICKDYIETMSKSYPNVNFDLEINKIKSWLISNPKKNKTISGAGRFINSWFSKAQNYSGYNRQNLNNNVNLTYKAKIKEF